MISVFLFVIVGIGIWFDLFSCYLELRKNRHLGTASGLFGVTLIACYLLPLLLLRRPIISASVWIDAGILTAFHFSVLLVIPWVDSVWVRRKSEEVK